MNENTMKAGDWTRPCLDCGKHPGEVEFGVGVRRGSCVYRKSYCRGCVSDRSVAHYKANPEQARAREKRRERDWAADTKRRWEREGIDVRRKKRAEQNVRRVFGISLDEYEFRFEQQGGLCEICGCEIGLYGRSRDLPEGVRKAHLDHNHETGKIRSFLCDRCNVMIGMSQEDISTLLTAIEYLEREEL